MIKGVLLTGGEGTRLRPFTEVVNKHLIRVHDKPMAEYPLLKMVEAGIRNVLIVTGGENFAAVVKYFGSGRKWNININYAIQDKAGGIAQALGLAETFIGDSQMLVCLGDNLWNANIYDEVQRFSGTPSGTAMLFSIESETPERFGVLEYDEYGLKGVVEKPKNPPSKEILVGIYAYSPEVFGIIHNLKPSNRGELEITDINHVYIKCNRVEVIRLPGWWTDCGSMDSILRAEELLKNDRPIPAIRS